MFTVYARLLAALFYMEYGMYLPATYTHNIPVWPITKFTLKTVWFKNLSRNVLSAIALT